MLKSLQNINARKSGKGLRSALSVFMALIMMLSLFPFTSILATPAYARTQVQAGDTINYRIDYSNPTSISRTIYIEDVVPKWITPVSGSISNGGSLSGSQNSHKINWTVTCAANSSGYVTWQGLVMHEGANDDNGNNVGRTIVNNATVTFGKISSSSNESNVSIPVTTSTYVIRNPIINGSATNGRIVNSDTGTDSNGNVRRASNQTFTYYPNDGYILGTLHVDGVQQDIGTYPDSYTFPAVQDDHTIDVVYVQPTISKSVTPTEDVRTNTTTLLYTLTYSNPSSIQRTVKLVDTLPKWLEFKADANGTPHTSMTTDADGNTIITWDTTIAANTTDTIGFQVVPKHEAAHNESGVNTGFTHTNSVSYTVYPITGSVNEKAVTYSDTQDIYVVRNPYMYGTVINGRITNDETNQPDNMDVRRELSDNLTEYYDPNDNYLLKSVVVDGKSLDIAQYPDEVKFNYIQDDHTIDVVYALPTTSKTAVIVESLSGNDEFCTGDVVRYTITVNNPTPIQRGLTITDYIPDNTSLVAGSITDSGSLDAPNRMIKWLINIGPSTSKSVSFDVKLDDAAKETTVSNTADVTIHHIPGSQREFDFHDSPEVEYYVIRNPIVTTEVENGTITDSIPSAVRDSSPVIEYHPDDGYFVGSITVDGIRIDPLEYVDSYTFPHIQKDHSIKVVYTQPTSEKTVEPVTRPHPTEEYVSTEVIKYSIKVNNPTDIVRNVDITDEVPQHMTLDESSISDGGSASNGVISWNIDIEPNSSRTVSFEVTLDHESASQDFTNEATVTMHARIGSVEESDIVMTPSVDISVAKNPDVYTTVINGTISPSQFDIHRGTAPYFEYSPDANCLIKSVMVDGRNLPLDEYPDNITFENIQDDHEVSVQYMPPELEKSSTIVESASGYDAYATTDVVEYSLDCGNPTYTARTFTVTDTLPEGITLVDGSISDGGVYDDTSRTITWTDLQLPATSSMTLTYRVTIDYEADGKTILNEATMVMRKIDGSDREQDATVISMNAYDVKDNPAITTEVKNGTITESIPNVERGEDYVIEYSPEENFLLNRVSVDGLPLDPTEYSSSYTFGSVQNSHNIYVEYLKPTLEKTSKVTATDNTFDKYASGDTVTFTLNATNTTAVNRTVTITDEVPDGLTYVDGTASDGGTFSNGTLTWELDIPANSAKAVTFNVTIDHEAGGRNISNTATAVFHKIPNSTTEEDAVITDDDSFTVLFNPFIKTEVENGTITETVNNVVRGSNQTISYSPNSGYLLQSVSVDGTNVDVATYIDGYTFTNVQEDHEIKVVYAAPITSKSSEITSGGTGNGYAAGDEVTYTIKVVNTTPVEREVTITDPLPSFLSLVRGTISDGGTANNGTITWSFQLPANSSKSVTFDAIVTQDAASGDVKNIAQVTVKKLPSSQNERDVVQNPEEAFNVTPNPIITTMVSNGTITPTLDPAARGEDATIEYSPNDGYIVKDVVVDGTSVLTDGTSSRYIFEDVQEDHVISVTYEKPTSAKTYAVKESGSGGGRVGVGDIVTYTITVSNTSAMERSYNITDVMPTGVVRVDETGAQISGPLETTITVPAKTDLPLSFDVLLTEDAAGSEVVNTATVVTIPPDPAGTEQPVTMEPSVTIDALVNPKVDTEVEGGTITPSMPDVTRGTDPVIEYTPNDGYLLASVTVDGNMQDITACGARFPFNNIQNDHNIIVRYVQPTADKEAVMFTNNEGSAEFAAADEVQYIITVRNPTSAERTVHVEDVLPDVLTLEELGTNENGSYNNGVITWDIVVHANSEKQVRFVASINHEAAGTNVTNVADVTYIALDGGSEQDVVLHPETTIHVKNNPKITTEVVNGTITDTITDVERAADTTIEYSSNEGYLLQSVTVDGEDIDISTSPDSYLFRNVQADHTIRVVYEAPETEKTATVKDDETRTEYRTGDIIIYKIPVTNPTPVERRISAVDTVPDGVKVVSGRISDNGTFSNGQVVWETEVQPNSTKELSFEAEVLHDAAETDVVNNAAVTIHKILGSNNEQDVVQNPSNTIRIAPNPNITTHVTGGTITDSMTDVKRGTDKTISYYPYDGYELGTIVVDGVDVTSDEIARAYVFENVQADHDIKVTFVKSAPLTITTSVTGGTITPTDDNVEAATDKVINYKPDEGYLLKSITVDGESVDISLYPSKYTFRKVLENHEIEVIFEQPTAEKTIVMKDNTAGIDQFASTDVVTYNITVNNPTPVARQVAIEDMLPDNTTLEEGSISDGGACTGRTIAWGLEIPANGSKTVHFNAIIGINAAATTVTNVADVVMQKMTNSTTEVDVTLHPEVSADIAENPKVITEVENGTITDTVESAPRGTDITIEYEADEGYLLQSITVDGNEMRTDTFNTSYVFKAIQADHNIKVVYAQPTAEKTVVVKGNESATTFKTTDTVRYTISVTNPTPVNRNITVTDTVPENMELVSGTINNGGTFDNGVITWEASVLKDSTLNLTFEAKILYEAGGTHIDNSATVIMHAISDAETDVTLEPTNTFAVLPNPSIVSSVTNGTITPTMPNIERGTNKVFEYAPDHGFELTSIKIDGEEVDISLYPTSYKFEGIQEDHTIDVTFSEIHPMTVTTSVVGGTITPTNDNVRVTTDYTVEYAPEEGYLLKSVTVDGEPIDITTAMSDYTFVDVMDNHSVDVVYVQPEAEKVVIITNSDEGTTTVAASDVVMYAIVVKNTTPIARDAVITDIVPENTTLVDGSISDDGTVNGTDLEWQVVVPANGQKTVTFEVTVNHEAATTTIRNNATVVVKGVDGTSENDVTLHPEASFEAKENPVILTQVENGTITDSILNAVRGQDVTIEYKNNEGYLLKSVRVDGNLVDIATFTDSYTFPAVQEDHVIKVIYDLPTSEKSAQLKGDPSVTEFKASDVMTYTIKVVNPTPIDRNVTIVDPAPANTTIVDGSLSTGGTLENNVATFEIVVPASGVKLVKFDVKLEHETGNTTVENVATVTMHAVDGSVNETDAVMEPSTEFDVIRNPKIETHVLNGTITPTDDNVVRGSTPEIEYEPDEGYVLKFVKLDGVNVSIANYPDKLPIPNVNDDHVVEVEYVQPGITKTASQRITNTDGTVTTVALDDGILSDGDMILYEIAYENPTTVKRTITIKDVLPSTLSVSKSNIGNNGVLEDGKITWTINAQAGAKGKVYFYATVVGPVAGNNILNTAKGTISKIPGSLTEENVQMSSVFNIPILPGPEKHVYTADGDLADDGIVSMGQELEYVITIENPSENAKVFNVTDVLPKQITADADSISDGGTFDEETNTIAWEVELGGKEVKELSFKATVNEGLNGGTTITNSATVEVDDTIAQTTEATVSVAVAPIKTAYNSNGSLIANAKMQLTQHAGEKISYVVTVVNPSSETKTFTITDVLPEGFTLDSLSQSGSYDEDTRTVTWIVDIPAKSGVNVYAYGEIDESAEGTSLVNKATAKVDASETESNDCIVPVMIAPVKDVTGINSSTSIDGQEIKAGTTFRYTIKITNPARTVKHVYVTDEIDKGVVFAEASDGGLYDTGTRTITWSLDVNPLSEMTLVVKVRVDQDTYWAHREVTVKDGQKKVITTPIKNSATLKIDNATSTSNVVSNVVIPKTFKLIINNKFKDDNDETKKLTTNYVINFTGIDGMTLHVSGAKNYESKDFVVTNGRIPEDIKLAYRDKIIIEGIPEGTSYNVNNVAVQGYTTTVTGDQVAKLDTNREVTFVHSKGEPQGRSTGKTGDESGIQTYVAILAAAVAVLAIIGAVVLVKSKKKGKSETDKAPEESSDLKS